MQELKDLNLIKSDDDSYRQYRITLADQTHNGFIIEKGKKHRVMFSGCSFMISWANPSEKIFCLHFQKDAFNGKDIICETTIYGMQEDCPTIVKIETADEITLEKRMDKLSKGNPDIRKELEDEVIRYGTFNGKKVRTTYKYKTVWEHNQECK